MWLEGRAVYREDVTQPGRGVSIALDLRGLHIRGMGGDEIAFWSMGTLKKVSGRNGLTLLQADNKAQVEITDAPSIAAFDAALKAIPREGDSTIPRGCMIGCVTMLALVVLIIVALFWGASRLLSALTPLVPDEMVAALDTGSIPGVLANLGSDPGQRCEGVDGNVALARLGERLSEAGRARRLILDIAVYRGSIANAVALPGGHVIITDKLIDRTPKADAFAGVLAHEIGHIHHRHGLEALIRNGGIMLTLTILTGDPSAITTSVLSTLAGAAYSRNAEREADSFAVGAVAAAGGDPTALSPFLIDLEKEYGATPSMLSFLATHPMSEERADNIEKDSASATKGSGPLISPEDWAAIRTICGS